MLCLDCSSWGRVWLWSGEALAEFTMVGEMSDEFFRHALVKGAQACFVDKVIRRYRDASHDGGLRPCDSVAVCEGPVTQIVGRIVEVIQPVQIAFYIAGRFVATPAPQIYGNIMEVIQFMSVMVDIVGHTVANTVPQIIGTVQVFQLALSAVSALWPSLSH